MAAWPQAVHRRRTDSHRSQTLGTRKRCSADTSKPLCRGTSSSRRACCLPKHSSILAAMESLTGRVLPRTYGCCGRINFPYPGSASTIAATLDCLRLVWFILARVSARAKIVAPPSRQEKGVKAVRIIPRSRRLDAKSDDRHSSAHHRQRREALPAGAARWPSIRLVALATRRRRPDDLRHGRGGRRKNRYRASLDLPRVRQFRCG